MIIVNREKCAKYNGSAFFITNSRWEEIPGDFFYFNMNEKGKEMIFGTSNPYALQDNSADTGKEQEEDFLQKEEKSTVEENNPDTENKNRHKELTGDQADETPAWEKDEDIGKRREAIHSIWDNDLSADEIAKQPVETRTKMGIDKMQQQTFKQPYRHDLTAKVRESYDYMYGTSDGKPVRPAFGLKEPERELSKQEVELVKAAPEEVRRAPKERRELALQRTLNEIGASALNDAPAPIDEDGEFGGQTSIALRKSASKLKGGISAFADGSTFGNSDVVAGVFGSAGGAVADMMSGKTPFSMEERKKDYEIAKAQQQRENAEFGAENPILAGALNAAGGVASGGGMAAVARRAGYGIYNALSKKESPFGGQVYHSRPEWWSKDRRLFEKDNVGEIRGILKNKETGDVSLPKGQYFADKDTGFGFEKISQKHPEVLDKMPQIFKKTQSLSKFTQ